MIGSERSERPLSVHQAGCECAACRRARLSEALLAFAQEHGLILQKDIGDSVAELIRNLGHFCEARELDFVMLVQQGVSCWRADLEGDEIRREFTAKLTITPRNAVPMKKHFSI